MGRLLFFVASGFLFVLSTIKGQVGDSIVISLDEEVYMTLVWIEELEIWAGKYEVTNQQYKKFMRFRDGMAVEGIDLSGDLQPAVFVSYCDVLGFCFWLNKNTNLPEGFQARLPTKKEWDYLIHPYPQSKKASTANWPPSQGNFLDETGREKLGWEWNIKGYNDGFAVSAPVFSTSENELGICGITDNVREWTAERYKDDNWHIIRGASWRDADPEQLKWDYGVQAAPWGRDNHIGFRIVLGPATNASD